MTQTATPVPDRGPLVGSARHTPCPSEWARDAEVVRGDLLDEDAVRSACVGVDVVYFLVHSLVDRDFAAIDRRAATIVARAARDCGVRRMDRLVGGVGLRRGRRDPDRLHTGDALDWWRVERLEDTDGEHLLRLRAEMKVPGRAWLELTVAARRLPAPRAGRAPVLVGRRAVPRAGVRRHGPQHHARRRTRHRRLIRASPSACRG